MKFKNFRPTMVRAVTGVHVIIAMPHEEIEVPKHLEELALANGLVPLGAVEDFESRQLEEARLLIAAADEKAKDDAAAKAKSAEILTQAAQSATDSLTPAQKGARTKASNKAGK